MGLERVASNSAQPWGSSSSCGPSSGPHLHLICLKELISLPHKAQHNTHRAAEGESVLHDGSHLPERSPVLRGGHLAGEKVQDHGCLDLRPRDTREQWWGSGRTSSLQNLSSAASASVWLESGSHSFKQFQCQHCKSHGKTN